MRYTKLPILIWALVFLNIICIGLVFLRFLGNVYSSSHTYSYVGKDYPLELPFRPPQAAMTFQESVHFRVQFNDTPAQDDWEYLVSQPRGIGRVWLGENYRMFVVEFYHEFHCLWVLEQALVDYKDTKKDTGHVTHCLNYLRQRFLCDADDSLERGDFTKRNFETERIADTVVCNDWEVVFSFMTENALNAKKFFSTRTTPT